MSIIERIKRLFPKRPCSCDSCTDFRPPFSDNPNVSHGLRMWVGRDDKLHHRATSTWKRM